MGTFYICVDVGTFHMCVDVGTFYTCVAVAVSTFYTCVDVGVGTFYMPLDVGTFCIDCFLRLLLPPPSLIIVPIKVWLHVKKKPKSWRDLRQTPVMLLAVRVDGSRPISSSCRSHKTRGGGGLI